MYDIVLYHYKKLVFKVVKCLSCKWFLNSAVCLLLCNCQPIAAQVIPDTSLPSNSTVIKQDNINLIEGGTKAGSNLFHSFQEFSVPTGEVANFNNTLDIQNIISRVTGRSISNIDGLIKASGTANLFLINHNGIIFGPYARLDIGGSFLASTASSLKFSDGIEFGTSTTQKPILTISTPIGLQYGQKPGNIQVNGSTLRVAKGKSIALIGGNVIVDGGNIIAPSGHIELGGVAEGNLGLDVNDSDIGLSFAENLTRADVNFTNTARIRTRADGGGSINVNAHNIELSKNSALNAGIATEEGTPSAQAGDIVLNASGNVKLQEGSYINNTTYGLGSSGKVIVNAQDVVIDGDGSVLLNLVYSGAIGNSGGIFINSRSLYVINLAELNAGVFYATDTSPGGRGTGGGITLNASDKVVFDGGFAVSRLEEGTIGKSGDIRIKTGSLLLTGVPSNIADDNTGQVVTATFGTGDAGNVIINASKAVILDGRGSDIWTLVAQDRGIGNAGNITIESPLVSITNNARVVSFVESQGNGGNINIKASELFMGSDAALIGDISPSGNGRGGNVNLDVKGRILLVGGKTFVSGESTRITLGVLPGGIGNSGNFSVKAGSLVLQDGAIIKASTQGQGNAGNMNIQADIVDISGSVFSSGLPSGLFTSTDTNGNAGDIKIAASSFRIADGAILSARARGSGQGGNIEVNASQTFEAVNGGQLLTQTFAQGRAGNIFVNAADKVTISGIDPNYANRIAKFPNPIDPFIANAITQTGANSGLFANTQPNSTGFGGNIEITAPSLQLQNQAQVSVSSQGSGSAGNIKIQANSIRLDRQANIKADTTAGQGNIELQASDLILRRNSNITTNARGSNVIGGNITLDTDILAAFENSDITANSEDFRGGNVIINTQAIFGTQFRDIMTAESDITATGANSQLNGNVQINTLDVDPTRGLVELPEDIVDRSRLIAQGCPANQGNTFIITGRGGVPSLPNELLRSDNPINVGWVSIDESKPTKTVAHNSQLTEIVEATSWEVNQKGEVILTAATPVNISDNIWLC